MSDVNNNAMGPVRPADEKAKQVSKSEKWFVRVSIYAKGIYNLFFL